MGRAVIQVHNYDISTLVRLLAENSKSDLSQISSKHHTGYFEEYFRNLGARSILVEPDYIDRDYLEDYSGYYARCFDDYGRRCVRLHFFQASFTNEDFQTLLENGSESSLANILRNSYLGFIVVKPLPRTVIGRTCLKTYPDDHGRRFFCSREYGVNLFGLTLKVGTLAFQEQDQDAAACATSALWTVFHGTGPKFQHPIPSPVEITKSANATGEQLNRPLPASDGLNAHQMAKAMRCLQLDPYHTNVSDEYLLKSTLYAYLKPKIPLVMAELLVDVTDPSNPRTVGRHAVALTGFSLGAPSPTDFNGFLLRATKMDKIYAHDDQLGPFSRMVFDGTSFVVEGANQFTLTTSWKSGGTVGNVRSAPIYLLIPLYHKIRIAFSEIHDTILYFDTVTRQYAASGISALSPKLEWDIYLTSVNELKESIFEGTSLLNRTRSNTLLQCLPRFIWVATALDQGKPVLTLLFDATDVLQGRVFLCPIEYDANMGNALRTVSKTPGLITHLVNNGTYVSRIFEWFANN